MSYRTVRQVQQAVWPGVCESLRLHRASRAAKLRGEPVSRMEERDARKSIERVVADETVWKIAHMDLLNTPAQAAVLRAARAWAADVGPDLARWPQDFVATDHALYQAVQALATDPDQIPQEELLTPAGPFGYGSPITNDGTSSH